ncbi:MAG: matrixin family metalloprotease [Candidatus Hodarchaeaceae archaeon]|nr:matrixin family metalloprotease [Candidatus Hodarchaeaceae archaeon]
MELFSYGGATGARGYSLDRQNTVSWVGIAPTTAVAITVIWYVPDTDGDGLDEIVEFDVILNALLKWGIDPDGEGPVTIKAYDIRNVATHEAGHVVGLADLYDAAYRELTMYGYTSKGETKKISLETGDIAGAQYLYGAPT